MPARQEVEIAEPGCGPGLILDAVQGFVTKPFVKLFGAVRWVAGRRWGRKGGKKTQASKQEANPVTVERGEDAQTAPAHREDKGTGSPVDGSGPTGELQAVRSGIAQAPAPALRVMVVATANGRQSRAVAATLTNVDPVSLAAQCQTLARQALLRASLRAALASQEALRARAPVNSRSLVAYSQPPAGQGFALVQAVGRYAAAAPAKAETHRVVRVLAEGPVWDGQDIKSWVCVLLTHDGFTITAKRVNTETGQWEVISTRVAPTPSHGPSLYLPPSVQTALSTILRATVVSVCGPAEGGPDEPPHTDLARSGNEVHTSLPSTSPANESGIMSDATCASESEGSLTLSSSTLTHHTSEDEAHSQSQSTATQVEHQPAAAAAQSAAAEAVPVPAAAAAGQQQPAAAAVKPVSTVTVAAPQPKRPRQPNPRRGAAAVTKPHTQASPQPPQEPRHTWFPCVPEPLPEAERKVIESIDLRKIRYNPALAGYNHEDHLGQGGYGWVTKCKMSLEQYGSGPGVHEVAMKWYRYLDTPAGHANYANEAAIHTYLNQFSSHPNVMTAIAQGYEQSLNMATLVFLAMTGDMRGLCSSDTPGSFAGRPISIVVDLLDQVACGLSRLHELGVVHCDVKPDNMLAHLNPLDPLENRAAIGDFGLSQILRRGKKTTHPRGTVVYSSPYLLKRMSDPVDTSMYQHPSDDVFAFAVSTQELLTGNIYVKKWVQGSDGKWKRVTLAYQVHNKKCHAELKQGLMDGELVHTCAPLEVLPCRLRCVLDSALSTRASTRPSLETIRSALKASLPEMLEMKKTQEAAVVLQRLAQQAERLAQQAKREVHRQSPAEIADLQDLEDGLREAYVGRPWEQMAAQQYNAEPGRLAEMPRPQQPRPQQPHPRQQAGRAGQPRQQPAGRAGQPAQQQPKGRAQKGKQAQVQPAAPQPKRQQTKKDDDFWR